LEILTEIPGVLQILQGNSRILLIRGHHCFFQSFLINNSQVNITHPGEKILKLINQLQKEKFEIRDSGITYDKIAAHL
jgi:hypothetical protein